MNDGVKRESSRTGGRAQSDVLQSWRHVTSDSWVPCNLASGQDISQEIDLKHLVSEHFIGGKRAGKRRKSLSALFPIC